MIGLVQANTELGQARSWLEHLGDHQKVLDWCLEPPPCILSVASRYQATCNSAGGLSGVSLKDADTEYEVTFELTDLDLSEGDDKG